MHGHWDGAVQPSPLSTLNQRCLLFRWWCPSPALSLEHYARGPVEVWLSVMMLILAFVLGLAAASSPVCHLSCNGHGSCDTTTKVCTCYKGWGAAEDVAVCVKCLRLDECSRPSRTRPRRLIREAVPSQHDNYAQVQGARLFDANMPLRSCMG